MRMLAHVIVVSMQHLLPRGSGVGWVEGSCREIVSLTIDSDMLISASAERVS